ncbi:MAG: hypothetical protein QW367_02635 [Candidatus Aenigmatarchaeota archaeon]
MNGKRIVVYLSEEDIKELEKRAKRLGLRLSTYAKILIKNSLEINEI